MARKRVIDQEHILDAAETVVARDGAAQLTLDAVAAVAEISKASVLYDYKSKAALIDAVVRRAVSRDAAFNQTMTEPYEDAPNAVIRGRIAAAAQPLPDDFRAVALNLCAALAQDTTLRSHIQASQTAVIDSIAKTSTSPRGARLAYLALEGLKLLEALDYHAWPADQRAEILAEIAWLVETRPPARG